MGRPQQRCAKVKNGRRCNRKFTPRPGTHRKNCFECSPPRELAPVADQGPGEAAEPVLGPVQTATQAELERLGQLGSVGGSVALRLARDLDGPGLAGSQAASLGKQLLQVMDQVSAGIPPEPDELDEFTARLNAKRASA